MLFRDAHKCRVFNIKNFRQHAVIILSQRAQNKSETYKQTYIYDFQTELINVSVSFHLAL